MHPFDESSRLHPCWGNRFLHFCTTLPPHLGLARQQRLSDGVRARHSSILDIFQAFNICFGAILRSRQLLGDLLQNSVSVIKHLSGDFTCRPFCSASSPPPPHICLDAGQAFKTNHNYHVNNIEWILQLNYNSPTSSPPGPSKAVLVIITRKPAQTLPPSQRTAFEHAH